MILAANTGWVIGYTIGIVVVLVVVALVVPILMLAKRRDLTIVEVPVEWHNDPDSRVHVLRGLPGIAWQLLRILLRFVRIR